MQNPRDPAERLRHIPEISVWSDSVKGRGAPLPPFSGDAQADVVIIGGGLSGLLTAHRLRQAGASCIVVEARRVGDGVTKNTTAKITAQHGSICDGLIQQFGREKAQLYYEANTRAIHRYRSLAAKYPCDLEEKTAYVYDMGSRAALEREAAAYESLGIAGHIDDSPELPVQPAAALGMPGQAQFNPMKLLTALSRELNIYENTFARTVEDGRVITDKGVIRCEHIILATHFPLVNIPGLYFLKLYQGRSYVLALKGAALPQGMYIGTGPADFSYRAYGDLLLLGGGGHKTGTAGGGFASLARFAGTTYPGAEIVYRWATQDCMTLDGVPYIGRHRAGAKNLYVATGFNKWGMTSAMTAAELLGDLILTGKSELEDLYSPRRSIWKKQLFVNLGAAAVGLLTPGGPRCSHMGCRLKRNRAAGTWDCACHGSRFDASGHIINNPAKRRIRP